MPYFKNENGVYFTSLDIAVAGGEPATEAEIQAFELQNQVPSAVKKTQLQAAMHDFGLLTTFNGLFAAVPPPELVMELYWQNEQIVERQSNFTEFMRQSLNLSASEIDSLFIAASEIVL